MVLWVGIAFVGSLLIARGVFPGFLGDYRSWNALPAHIATYLFLLTIIPGVFQRMGLNHLVIRLLIAWRRTVGIAMYFFALLHLLFLLDDLPWFSGGSITMLDILTATGLFAMIVLLPVLVTSNASSIVFFKKHWKTVQRMTYVAIALIGLHLYEAGELLLAALYGLTIVLIVASFVINTYRRGVFQSAVVTSCVLILCGVGITSGAWWRYVKSDVVETTATTYETALTQDDATPPIPSQTEDEALSVEKEEEKFDEDEGTDITIESLDDMEYVDGIYEANGEFVTARGKYTESVDITLTIKDDIVTDMKIVGNITNRKSQQYQDRFEASIGGEVLSKDIGSIEVDAVAGASDTTDGFMVAVESIRAQARR